MIDEYFESLLDLAVREDLGAEGDVTSKSIFSGGETTEAVLVSKDTGILCGCAAFNAVFARIDPKVSSVLLKSDGDTLSPGDRIAEIRGSTLSILQSERIAINFLGFLSGIATIASLFSKAAAEKGKTLVLDTRKTLPGYRSLSKYAVRVGGGKNHRMGLYDMVLIKDNHIDASGGITRAVERARASYGDRFPIEVECRTVKDVEEALGLGVQWIMLDNMSEDSCLAALRLRGQAGKAESKFEASGNMTLSRVGGYSAIGVDYISVGALTHSVKSFDFSLLIDKKGGKDR